MSELPKGDRIAKFIARAGICSRRAAEKLIDEGRVFVNNKTLNTPAFTVTKEDIVMVDGEIISVNDEIRLWIYNKPKGLITTHSDPQGRETIFKHLPKILPRVISVGRLDINSEGLLLLTNSGELANFLSHPSNKFVRIYRVRAFGDPTKISVLEKGIKTEDGMRLRAKSVRLDKQKGGNCWFTVQLTEGKNREIRRMFEYIGMSVNRLIRTNFGEYKLADLPSEEVKEVNTRSAIAMMNK